VIRAGLPYYAIAVITVAVLMRSTDNSPNSKEVDAMTWSDVKVAKVPAKPTGIWTLTHEFVKGPALIKVEATGTWAYSSGRPCGPDGDLNALLSADQMIAGGVSPGALLIKVGGSTAAVSDGLVRVAGSTAVIRIDEKTAGPIFLTINDAVSGFADNSGELDAKVSIAQLVPENQPATEPKKKPAAAQKNDLE
jgi:hypothetical protein